jgi:hypothetical protein
MRILYNSIESFKFSFLSLFNQTDNQTNSKPKFECALVFVKFKLKNKYVYNYILAATLDIESPKKSNFVEWNPIKYNYVILRFI